MKAFFEQLDWLQWLATAITIGAAWFTGSSREERRRIGFWAFLGSNALWAWWAVQHQAWGLLTMQAALAAMNVRGVRHNAED